MHSTRHDVIVIGGGAAGLSAALVLGRARRRVAVVDSGAPRNAPAEHMQGFLSRDGLPPRELLAIARDEIARYGVELLAGEVAAVEAGFAVRVADGRTLSARRLLLATGAVDVMPDIPGLAERWGRDVLHCPYCHGWEVRDEALAVLGSVEHALLVREWTDDLLFFPHTHDLTDAERGRLERRGIRVVDGDVRRLLVEDDRLTGVELADGQRVDRTVVFIRPELRPRLLGVECELDELGFVRVDAFGRTSVPGLYAAGNVANPRAQVITAAGEGSAAAIAINNDLVQEDSP